MNSKLVLLAVILTIVASSAMYSQTITEDVIAYRQLAGADVLLTDSWVKEREDAKLTADNRNHKQNTSFEVCSVCLVNSMIGWG